MYIKILEKEMISHKKVYYKAILVYYYSRSYCYRINI